MFRITFTGDYSNCLYINQYDVFLYLTHMSVDNISSISIISSFYIIAVLI